MNNNFQISPDSVPRIKTSLHSGKLVKDNLALVSTESGRWKLIHLKKEKIPENATVIRGNNLAKLMMAAANDEKELPSDLLAAYKDCNITDISNNHKFKHIARLIPGMESPGHRHADRHDIQKLDPSPPAKGANYLRGPAFLDPAMTAGQVHHYTKNRVFTPYLYAPLTEYVSGSPLNVQRVDRPHSNNISCADAKAALEKSQIFKDLCETEYNCFSVVSSFIQHAKDHPELKAAKAFHTFVPDMSEDIESLKGSSCTGATRAFLKSLKNDPDLKDLKLDGYPVMERGSLLAVPTHTAAMVPCKDGVLFIELMPPPRVLVLKENETTSMEISLPDNVVIKTDFKIVNVEGDYKISNTVMTKSDLISEAGVFQKTQTQFFLRGVVNPDAPVMHRYMLAMRVYPVIGNDKEGNQISIKVNFDDKTVSFERENPFRKIKLPFKVFDESTKRIDLNLETNKEKRTALEKSARELFKDKFNFFNNNDINDYFDEFQAPQELKEQIFLLTSKDGAKIMTDLYKQVGRNPKQLEPPPPSD